MLKITLGQSFSLDLPLSRPNSKPLAMIWIAPGSFDMGSPEDELGRTPEEEKQFSVTLTQGFWLGTFPVTQAQWEAVMDNNPSYFSDSGSDRPVENLAWQDAMSFCQKLSKKYRSQLPNGYEFRLPTETEWEYACRAGTQTMYNVGNSLAELSMAAWHRSNSDNGTHVVGEKAPNQWGLYDMHGNVMEWCLDSASDYPSSPAVDWVGTGDPRVRNLRGASWNSPPEEGVFRSAQRICAVSSIKNAWTGMRLCLGTVKKIR
jgi:formylglycine-generating enzyme required for sulfatase activity